jgi:hypothetical protein
MNSFRPEKVYTVQSGCRQMFSIWEHWEPGMVGNKRWAPKGGRQIIRLNLQTDPWSRYTYQQTDGIRPNGIGEGGPGRSKNNKNATGYTNQVINMLRWMIKKAWSCRICGRNRFRASFKTLPPSPIFCFKRERKNRLVVFFPGKAEVYDALLIKYGIGSAKDLVFSKY